MKKMIALAFLLLLLSAWAHGRHAFKTQKLPQAIPCGQSTYSLTSPPARLGEDALLFPLTLLL